jgi:hypothetical protein
MRNRIHEQLAAMRIVSGWSFQQLLDKATPDLNARGIKLCKSQLIRRLSGEADLETQVAEVLVDTFRRGGVDATIMWPPRRASFKAKRAA